MAQIETKKTIKTASIKKVTKKVTTLPVEKKVEVKEVRTNTAKYINKNLKVSPRKLRLLVADIKKIDPQSSLIRLRFTNTNAARLLCKCVEDAIASAKNNYKLLPQTLKFTEMRVDEGMKIKRMDKSHGSRFARGIIQKRHSRLTIILSGTIAG